MLISGIDLEGILAHQLEAPIGLNLPRRDWYRAWVDLARDEALVLWVLLVRSSPGRHHVWALFERSVEQADHNDLAKRVLKATGPLRHIDASSLKCRRGLGCPLRAPWSWKEGRRSEAVQMWLRDQKRLLHLAALAEPTLQPEDPLRMTLKLIEKGPRPAGKLPSNENPSAGWWSKRIKPGPSKKLLDDLFRELVQRYPITGFGQRDQLVPRVILFLFNCGLMPLDIDKVGLRWLAYFEKNYRMPLAQAQRELVRCVNRTERKLFWGKLAPARSSFDYDEFFKKTTLTRKEERLVEEIFTSPAGSSASSYPCHPLPGEGMTGTGESPRFRSVPRSFVECIILQAKLKLHEGKQEGELLVDWTNRQMVAALRARCRLELDCQQLHRLKKKFISFLGKEGSWLNAQQVEILREVRKGFREPPGRHNLHGWLRRPGGLPSLYQPAPALLAVIQEGKVSPDEQADRREAEEADLAPAGDERLEVDGRHSQFEAPETAAEDETEGYASEPDWEEIDFWLDYRAAQEIPEDDELNT